MEQNIETRKMLESDIDVFYNTYLSYGWHPNIETYKKYIKEQKEGKRLVFVATFENKVAGICTLLFKVDEPFIEDLSVFKEYQNKGIGNKLLDICENEAKNYANIVYLYVGLHSGYGEAQRIYAKRGYIPDGNGVYYKGKVLEQYVECVNDDDLLLKLYKKL